MRQLASRTFWVFPIARSPRIASIEPSINFSKLKRRSSAISSNNWAGCFDSITAWCSTTSRALTSKGLAVENELAQRGYSRDHRSDCKQIVVALVVTKDGFPLAHRTFAGNTQDLKTVQTIVGEIERQFGTSRRIWVMDRGMISDESLKFLGESNRRYLLATKRGELAGFQADLGRTGWNPLPKNPQVQVKLFERESVHYLLRGVARDAERNGRSAVGSVVAWRPISRSSRSDRCGKAQETGQDPRTSRALEGAIPQGPRLRTNQRDRDETAPAGVDVGPSKVPASFSHGWGLLVTKQPTWLDGGRILENVYSTHDR